MATLPSSIWQSGDYRSVLLKIFNTRVDERPRYSLRKFASELEVTPSALSEIFSRKRGLSRERAFKIARKLELTGEEAKFFVDLVEGEHARSGPRGRVVRARVRNRVNRSRFTALEADRFRIIEDWFHFAIVELTYCNSFVSDPAWIAARLGLRKEDAERAIERLLRVGMVRKTGGKLVAVDDFTLVVNPNEAADSIRKAHRQILNKAITAIGTQRPESREVIYSVISIHADQIAAAKEALKKFSDQFVTRFGSPYLGGKTDVYSVNFQLFSLLEPEKNKGTA